MIFCGGPLPRRWDALARDVLLLEVFLLGLLEYRKLQLCLFFILLRSLSNSKESNWHECNGLGAYGRTYRRATEDMHWTQLS